MHLSSSRCFCWPAAARPGAAVAVCAQRRPRTSSSRANTSATRVSQQDKSCDKKIVAGQEFRQNLVMARTSVARIQVRSRKFRFWNIHEFKSALASFVFGTFENSAAEPPAVDDRAACNPSIFVFSNENIIWTWSGQPII